MNSITAALVTAKSTIDRLLSNGNADPKSGLIRSEDIYETWDYAEPFSGPELSVEYWYKGKTWVYRAKNNATDSAFFSKTGTARTLREARLLALATVEVALCAIDADPQPLEVDSDGNLLNGHLQEKAAKMLGITDRVACKVVSGDEKNAGCTAQASKGKCSEKEWLLKLMTGAGGHENAVNVTLGSAFLPNDILRRW